MSIGIFFFFFDILCKHAVIIKVIELHVESRTYPGPSDGKVPQTVVWVLAETLKSCVESHSFWTEAVSLLRGICHLVGAHPDSFWPATWVDNILHSTSVATTSCSTVEGTMRVLCNYCMCSSFSAFCHRSIWVPSKYPQQYCDWQ